VPNAIISWGSAGTVASPTQDNTPASTTGLSFKVGDCDQQLTESKRQTEIVEIADPSNPNGFTLSVERIKSITFGTGGATPNAAYVDVSGFVHDPAFGSNPITDPCEHVYNLNPPTGTT
jgi:hypothetical protein